MPLGEEVDNRKYREESQAASQKAWASCLSQPGTYGHVSTSCPQKTNQALCLSVCASVEYGHSPSTGWLLFGIRIHFAWTSSKHIPNIKVQYGFNIFILYLLSEQRKCAADMMPDM